MTINVMVSFPDEFLSEVDQIASEEHRNRSELLHEAMRLYIKTRRRKNCPVDDPCVRRAITTQDRLARISPGTGEDSTIDVRHWREGR